VTSVENMDTFIVEAKLKPDSTSTRHLVCHEIIDESYPVGRSIRILNMFPLVNDKALKQAFDSVSSVESVVFDDDTKEQLFPQKEIKYRTVVVVFKNATALIELTDKKVQVVLTSKEHPLENTLDIWRENYNKSIISCGDIIRRINAVVDKYDEEAAKRKKEVKESTEADEEGWITVRRGKPESMKREHAILEKNKAKAAKKKRLEADVAEMYQYRIRESKLGQLRQLREKFEADKLKIAQIKAGRKFRPF